MPGQGGGEVFRRRPVPEPSPAPPGGPFRSDARRLRTDPPGCLAGSDLPRGLVTPVLERTDLEPRHQAGVGTRIGSCQLKPSGLK